jgi:hypothetical protein
MAEGGEVYSGWRCPDHTPLVQAVGRTEGKIDTILANQQNIKDGVEKLVSESNARLIEHTNDKISFSRMHDADMKALVEAGVPYKWAKRVVVGTGGAVGILLIQGLFPKLLHFLAEVYK